MKTMKKFTALLAFFLLILGYNYAQVVTTTPGVPLENESVTITFNAAEGNGGLAGYTGEVYAHTGVITSESTSSSDWKYVISDWGVNIPEALLTSLGNDMYELAITPSIREFYGVPEGEQILQMAFVFRSATTVNGSWLEGKNTDGTDILIDVFSQGLYVLFVTPEKPALVDLNSEINVEIAATEADWIKLYLDNEEIANATGNSLTHTVLAEEPGKHYLKAEAGNSTGTTETSTYFFVKMDVVEEPLPEGAHLGLNRNSSTSVTLVFHDPAQLKENVFLIGSMNNWEMDEDFYMKKFDDGTQNFWWITINGLSASEEYVYQYLVDGDLILADPYCDKILDPWNDQYIPADVYPNLTPYPVGYTSGIASTFTTTAQNYDWQVENFERPAITDLVVYELHLRDFTLNGAIGHLKSAIEHLDYLESLGVNAIELMPINEFEGNDSWGYNPSFYFAFDKAYGTKEDFKSFVDECHSRGIAVIIDLVLNHTYGQSPFLQMYMGDDWQATADNPWYNQSCPHEPWCWGADLNHLSPYTQALVDSVNSYWINEFKVDGFRFDFTKGFTNYDSGNQGSNYNSERIGLLKRMLDEVREYDSDAYLILEHLTDNSEEKELANYGLYFWGNMNHSYCEAAMGWNATSNLSWASYKERGWTYPNLVTYMESHDEERVMYKNLQYGNANGNYNIKELETALDRIELASAFFFTIPGPKMIWQFGEVGYDVSIDFPCRVCQKPVRWYYTTEPDRQDVYETFAELIYLKKNYDVFRTDNFTMSVGNWAQKRINLYHASMDVAVIGNFDVVAGNNNPNFSRTGWWYEYFSGDSTYISDISVANDVYLEAGEYHLYSSTKIVKPEIEVPIGINPVNATNEVLVYPNPSENEFNIEFMLNGGENVTIRIYDTFGRIMENIEQKNLPAGSHHIVWNAEQFTTGIYFCEVVIGNKKVVKKLILK